MNFDMTFEELKELIRSEYGEFIEDSCYDSPESLLKALEDLSEHVDCSTTTTSKTISLRLWLLLLFQHIKGTGNRGGYSLSFYSFYLTPIM